MVELKKGIRVSEYGVQRWGAGLRTLFSRTLHSIQSWKPGVGMCWALFPYYSKARNEPSFLSQCRDSTLQSVRWLNYAHHLIWGLHVTCKNCPEQQLTLGKHPQCCPFSLSRTPSLGEKLGWQLCEGHWGNQELFLISPPVTDSFHKWHRKNHRGEAAEIQWPERDHVSTTALRGLRLECQVGRDPHRPGSWL
jgi:hypothetical protein